MSVSKHITTPKLFEYLDTEVKSALSRHEIYALFDYSWIDEDTPNPEFIGLAKWSVDGLHGLFQPDDRLNFYTQKQFEFLMTVCSDLESLMEISRLAIGNALWMAELAKEDVFDHNHHFWLNHINSLTLLGMASDRLRDLFLAVTFKETFYEYKNRRSSKNFVIEGHQSNHYQYPFLDAKTLPKASMIEGPLSAIISLAASIYEQREGRNKAVHEVATRAAALTKRFFDRPDGEVAARLLTTASKTSNAWALAEKEHRQTIDSSAMSVIKWYRNLVSATSCVFDIEHTLRMSFAKQLLRDVEV